jgi:hypothetical protein
MTTAFILPIVLVVLSVGHDFKDENLVAPIKDARHEPIFVASDVEYDARTDKARAAKRSLDIPPRMPSNSLAVDMGMPSTQRAFGVLMACGLPPLLQASLRDYAHFLPYLLSISEATLGARLALRFRFV